MPTWNLTLDPKAVAQVHDILVCLGRFSETVSIEARRNKFILTTLNSSKSAYASFTFDAGRYFDKYYFGPAPWVGQQADDGCFTCRIYNKALLSVFKSDSKDKDTAIEKCEISVQDRPQKAQCRLVVKLTCRHGVLKTYKLTYESVEVMHALFDKGLASNRWRISSKPLKEFIEHFGPRTEQLDIYQENGRATFTSYTEKIVDGKEILKQPLHTSVAIGTKEFEEFCVEEKLHIAFSVKDFKAIITHADSLNASITALYSKPTRPLQIAYESDNGMLCEFTLMTIGDHRGGSVTPAPSIARTKPNAPDDRQTPTPSNPLMPPPSQPLHRPRQSRPSPPPPKASLDPESLFFPEDESPSGWDDRDEREEEDLLGWDGSEDNDLLASKLNRIGKMRDAGGDNEDTGDDGAAVPPTQRSSHFRGLFDD
ncbi:MAG: hypothetical protein M1839_007599 [Geoglossum umbratile]|nr:MAG: hypothetical protein M1839_007599 [Geoglossum umbratile]